MEKICIHAFVSGTVQGVFFRNSAKRQAEALNITGWTRNLTDGRVEVFACGEPAQLERFQVWLAKGPDSAKVEALDIATAPYENHNSFEIIRSK